MKNRSLPRLVLPLAALVVAAGACGGGGAKPKHPTEPEALEKWQTEREWVLVSKERCVTGPFEIEVPGRDVEFGRRFVVEVFGKRSLPMDTQMTYESGSSGSGWGWSEEGLGELGDHSACQAEDDDVELAPATAGGGDGRRDRDDRNKKRRRRRQGEKEVAREEENPEPDAPLPTLDPHEGPLPGLRRHGAAIAWFPQGNPNYYALDRILSQYYSSGGGESFRFKFWFHRPVDMDGVVIRIRDQLLIPTGPIGPYRASFAARVAEVKKRKELGKRSVAADRGQSDPARGKVPPPPKKEVVPEAPGKNVVWLSGYWKYHDELEDFVWVAGTFVVREPPEPPPAVVAQNDAKDEPPAEADPKDVPPEDPAPPEHERSEPAETPRPIDSRVPPKPKPRREVIPPPPALAGAIWVPGYWQLQGTTWRWIAGKWQVPRRRGTRFRAPSIELRGRVKVYLPGGWTLGGR